MYETCNNSSKEVEFREIWSRLETLDEVEIYRDIGCMRKCQRMEWKAKTIYANQEMSEDYAKSESKDSLESGENMENLNKSDNQEKPENQDNSENQTKSENQDKSSTLSLKLFYNTGLYHIREQYYTYGLNSFVADFGGYLGLLLGHSILSAFDLGRDVIACIKEKRNVMQ